MGAGLLEGVAATARRVDGDAVEGRRDRTAMSAALRGVAEAPDLASAGLQVCECAAWLLGAGTAAVVRSEDADRVVVAAVGRDAPPPGQSMLATGTLAAVLALGCPQESRRARVAEVAAPVVLRGSVWGALLLSGSADALAPAAAERLAPFADLLSLAAANHETRSRLASLAGTDALTGLGNRRTFDDLLAAEENRAVRHGDALGLVLLDLDHFKGVNDRFGHGRGDRVLVEVGRRLVGIARRGEAVTRIGGEEFAWLLPRTTGAGAEAAARRALAVIAGRDFEVAGRLTASAGVCDLATAGGRDEMVRLADLMLYRAKADGRDTVRAAGTGTAALSG
ncbi:GGDEF domain-containing protein [Miltoncostaea oceani]|uniref:GGDEF domain-containing protein n=1 Tax=Miltoncostaea oceani TaxID=2843216 RepID=UPI001C3D09FF|nr:GGDEF domain-containing protein [Miltoncostaea oceani]